MYTRVNICITLALPFCERDNAKRIRCLIFGKQTNCWLLGQECHIPQSGKLRFHRETIDWPKMEWCYYSERYETLAICGERHRQFLIMKYVQIITNENHFNSRQMWIKKPLVLDAFQFNCRCIIIQETLRRIFNNKFGYLRDNRLNLVVLPWKVYKNV